jgi:hypothetical protein
MVCEPPRAARVSRTGADQDYRDQQCIRRIPTRQAVSCSVTHRGKKMPQAATCGIFDEVADLHHGLLTTIVGGMKNDGLSYVIDGPVMPVTLKVVEGTEAL